VGDCGMHTITRYLVMIHSCQQLPLGVVAELEGGNGNLGVATHLCSAPSRMTRERLHHLLPVLIILL